jgi:hypothetical protein
VRRREEGQEGEGLHVSSAGGRKHRESAAKEGEEGEGLYVSRGAKMSMSQKMRDGRSV